MPLSLSSTSYPSRNMIDALLYLLYFMLALASALVVWSLIHQWRAGK